MKVSSAIASVLALVCCASASSHVLPCDSIVQGQCHQQQQQPLDMSSQKPSERTLSDVLGRDRGTTIFASLVRDEDTIAALLADGSQNIVILAPSNEAMAKMRSKPWEDPDEYNAFGTDAYSGQDGESRAHENTKRFVQAHVVTVPKGGGKDLWNEGQNGETKNARTVWWEDKDGEAVLKPDNIKVVRQEDRVSNGMIWVLDGTLKRS